MKTADLISALAHDLNPVERDGARRWLRLAALAGACLAVALLLAWLGFRPLGEAVSTPPFWMKAVFTSVLAIAGLAAADRVARPGGTGGPAVAVIGAAVVLMTALGLMQLFAAPPDERLALWLGRTWSQCPFRIMALAVPVFVAVVLAMRRMAPTAPVAAGAAAGLMSGAVGATVYGLHCPETAAAFVATWYTLGIAACAALGALAGPRLLRW